MSMIIHKAHTASPAKLRIVSCIIAALYATLACVSIASTAGKSPGEYEIKAAFIYNFAKFVQWPSEAFAASNSPLVIGVLGDDPFGSMLDRTIEGKYVNSRRLEVQRYREVRDLRACQILYVCSSENKHLAKVLDAVKNWHTLTVGESEMFCQNGGILGFYIENKKVRFEANLEASRKANLSISSKLLKLARIVKN